MDPSEPADPREQRPGHRPPPDPLAMTPAEKLVAEWEARHDVAARGHRGAPGAVQHYLAESRARDVQRPVATAPAEVPARPAPRAPHQAEAPAPPSRRRWWPFHRPR
ncbi:hypothetical protein GCM10023328_11720 [Modestobacter marinus]|uniref:Uncharacterized protein n=1 Tax=Modestobacter marinus TaxID=477641 RepID=A0A846LMK6_9ACTN|nr:hypothetical protein [Modestobacter marinus]NIH69193.1 hypothetical protein [Modestobacter marinus]GGL76756.1 hypothetical protein GCM10011589_36070 [Modestobacter marinus]